MDLATTLFPLIVVAQANQTHTLRASILAGICFHPLVARPEVEFERLMRRFLGVAGILSGLDLLASVYLADRSLPASILQLCVSWSGFVIGLLASLSVYRLMFHRCRKFPGPVIARLSRFYTSYLNAQEEQFYRKLAIIHERYGDYVRIGPRELSVLDPAAISVIYGPKTQCTKSPFYNINGGHDDVLSINGIRDPVKYRLRRRAWDRGLSTKALHSYQPRIKGHTDELIKQVRAQVGQPTDVTAWAMFFAFDAMGDVAFSKDFGNMTSGQEHPGLQQMHGYLSVLGVVQAVPWLPSLLSGIPGATRGIADFYNFCNDVLAEREKSFSPDKEPSDVISWLLKAVYEKDASASPTQQSILDDNRGVIIAGSDTSANTLANALFYLAKYQAAQQKLRLQLDTSGVMSSDSWDYSKLKTVTYLDSVINETLRLKPPIIQGLPRETPAQGIHVGETYIPGNVIVSVPTILIQRDSRWWKQPNEFIPERFTERKVEMETADAPWIPFQIGMHACAGKGLAYMTLRIAISALVQNFEINFAPGETGEKFDGDFLASFMMVLRPMKLIFTPRSNT